MLFDFNPDRNLFDFNPDQNLFDSNPDWLLISKSWPRVWAWVGLRLFHSPFFRGRTRKALRSKHWACFPPWIGWCFLGWSTRKIQSWGRSDSRRSSGCRRSHSHGLRRIVSTECACLDWLGKWLWVLSCTRHIRLKSPRRVLALRGVRTTRDHFCRGTESRTCKTASVEA